MGGERRIETGNDGGRFVPGENRLANEAWTPRLIINDTATEKISTQAQTAQQHAVRANNLIDQLKQIQGLSDTAELKVQDSTKEISLVKVSDLRRRLNEGINEAFGESLRRLSLVDPKTAEVAIASAAAALKKRPDPLETMKHIQTIEMCEQIMHAPKEVRIAWSTYQVDRAVDNMARLGYLDSTSRRDFKQAAEILQALPDGERKNDRRRADLLDTIAKGTNGKLDAFLPGLLCEQAQIKAAAGNTDEAEQMFRSAIERADQRGNRKDDDPSIEHLASTIRIQYLKSLLQTQKLDLAADVQQQLLTRDRDFVLRNTEFRTIDEALFFKGKAENPYVNVSKLQAAFERKDMQEADRFLKLFEQGAKEVNRDGRQTEKIKELKELISKEIDATTLDSLKQELAIRQAYLRAPSVGDYLHGRLALAAGDKQGARALFERLKKDDGEFASDPKLEIGKLVEMCDAVEESGAWAATKHFLKELACDVVAIGAGIGAAVLTGWSGPAALAVGAGAGAASYTGMKAMLFGTDSITWTTPVWGALDGMSGGGAALARNGLTRIGGKLISKEMAERTVLRAGGEVSGLAGLEGFELGGRATMAAKQGLKELGVDLPRLTRFRSAIPMAGGDAEYRAALSGYRSIRNTYYGLNAARDFGATATGSFIFNSGRGAANYYEGKTGFLETGEDIASNTLKDGMLGVFLGPAGRRLGGRFADTSLGNRLCLPGLNQQLPGALAPKIEQGYDKSRALLDMWLQERRMRRGFNNDEIYDRYLKEIPGTGNPRVILNWDKRN
jgi:tetratricopeptide (TPR) repeat protein